MQTSQYIAVAAAIISLTGALSTWYNLRRATFLATNNVVSEAILKLNQLFINEPQLWPYMIQAKKPLPGKYEPKARVISVMMLNIFEAIWSQKKGMDKANRRSWASYISWQIKSVDIITEAYEKNHEWYPNLQTIAALKK